MSGTVCIIGAGELGGAVADALARSERVARVRIVDDAAAIASGKALDIQQAGAIAGCHARLEGTSDLSRVTGCDVCVLADRAGRPSTEWQGDEARALIQRVMPYLGAAPLVCAGSAQADAMQLAAREARLRRERVIGSAPEALAAATRAIVAMEAGCSPAEVSLTMLGAPHGGFVVPWSDASIGGYALERVLTQVQLTRIEARVPRLWPPGPFALGAAAARVTEAIIGSSRRALCVLTVLSGEFGVKGRVGTLPAVLSTSGIVQTRVPTLNTRERVRLETALGG
jgi:malate dehydrogenase